MIVAVDSLLPKNQEWTLSTYMAFADLARLAPPYKVGFSPTTRHFIRLLGAFSIFITKET